MTLTIAWWDLTDADVTIETLEQDLRSSIHAWNQVEGLHVKLWIADRDKNRWGAVMWWGTRADSAMDLPPNRAAELIGFPPTHRSKFDVIGTATGITIEP